LLFFAGDMLFYGYFGSGAGFREGLLATVRQSSRERLFAGGLVGPIAACLCIVGFWHVYLNVKLSGRFLGRVMLASFVALMVAGSAVHVLWAAKGLALKYCSDMGSPCADVVSATKSYWDLAYLVGSIPGYLGALLLAGLILAGKTSYSRWTIFANPGVLLLLLPLATRLPAPLGSVVVGGFTNLSIAVFFLVSVCTTWTSRAD